MMLPCRKIEGKKCLLLFVLFLDPFFRSRTNFARFFIPSENSIIIAYSFVPSVLKLEAHDRRVSFPGTSTPATRFL